MKSKQPLPRPLLPKAEPGSSSTSPTQEGGSPPSQNSSKRRCISSACMPCRRRKSKCDGAQPSCSACISVYSSQCYYDIDSDHRRKGALKRDILQLTQEKEAQTIILDAIRNGSESDVDDIVQYIRASPEESFQCLAEEVQKMGHQLTKVTKKLEPQSLESTLADYSGQPGLEKSEQVQHYGHTSNLALIGGDNSGPSQTMDQLGTWTTVTNDKDLIQHLMDLYFTHSHSFYVLFSREIFLHGMNNKKLKYCTPLLFNAILAQGCTWSDRPEARADPSNPDTLGDHFFAEAKRLLDLEEESKLTTVQALALMSLFQAERNRDSSGWRYVGQSMSMLIELLLHVSHSTQAHCSFSPTEMEARKVTFWGCFTLDTLWAFCIGRISVLPRAAIRLEKPIPEAADNQISGIGKGFGLPPDGAASEQRLVTNNLVVQLSHFSEIVADVVHMFYAPRDRITSRRLQHHHEQFLSWFRKLPECLQINSNGPTPPQVITLHMYYQNCVLHLFRPFLKVSFIQSSKSPHQICTEAADTISQLSALCTRQHGPRRLIFIQSHCVMSAAIIHLVNLSATKLSQPLNERATADLADAIRNLSAMHRTFPVVIRYMKAIRSLIHQWLPVIPPVVQQAMIDSGMPSPSNPATNMNHRAISNSTTISNPSLTPGSSTHSHTAQPSRHPPAKRKYADSEPNSISLPHQDLPRHTPPSNTSTTIHAPQQFFWTPFPDHVEGIPLPLPNSERNQLMDIGNMLDSGVDAAWAQLNRDGFTMDQACDLNTVVGVSVGVGKHGEARIWEWDRGA